ncbi:MAG TPA: hypothetical protein VEV17_22440, partial [Bryobacteraceae bacterium]|nr:hypothetical protein [Bryobacteraceae bacterium]
MREIKMFSIASSRLRRQVMLVVLAILALEPGQAADALKFFKNYFVTGDYAVNGVGLRALGVNDPATAAIAGTS